MTTTGFAAASPERSGGRHDAIRLSRPDGRPTARFLLLVGGLSLFGPLCIDMYLPALPRIAADLSTSPSAVQLSLTTCLFGLGLGQLTLGPLSDRLGRRRPLAGGLVLFVVASLSCALAPTAPVLVVLRLFQGLGGSAGIVIARAVVRDLHAGTAAARVFSMLMLVTGAGPVLAPQIGAELLRVTSWRGVFIALAIAGSALLCIAMLRLPETLPLARRERGGLTATFHSMRSVATNRLFLQNAIACGLGFGAIFAYVAGSSFVMENRYGLSPQLFGVVFALNACGLVAAGQVNAHIVGRFGSERLLTCGLCGLASGGVAVLVVISSGKLGLAGLLPCLFVVVAANGFIGPNATALALNDFPHAAGSASALLGVMQFSLGAAVAPLVGLGGTSDAMPMAIAMACLGVAALSVRIALTRLGHALVIAPGDTTLPVEAGVLESGV